MDSPILLKATILVESYFDTLNYRELVFIEKRLNDKLTLVETDLMIQVDVTATPQPDTGIT